MNPAFDMEYTVWADVALIPHRYTEEAHRLFVDQVLARLRSTTGVRSASCAASVPLALRSGQIRGGLVEIEGVQGKPHDPLSYMGTAALLGLVAVAAGLAPARRAARVDPMTSLRHE